MSDFGNLNIGTGPQRGFDLIPAGTIATVQIEIKPGGAGRDPFHQGWLRTAKDGLSAHLYCEFKVVDGQYAGRVVFGNYTLEGDGPNYDEARRIARDFFRAVLESVRGVRPDDKSPEAEEKRRFANWGEVNGMRFPARIGVMPAKDGYEAKNIVRAVVTPDEQAWKKPEQIDRSGLAPNPAVTPARPTQPTQPPAGAVARPDWA